jgi:predicted peptidase
VTIPLRCLSVSIFLGALIALPANAKKKHDTGFLDRSLELEGTEYKYQVFVPENWKPDKKWPIILFLHGSGERGDDGLVQTDEGIGTAIREDRGRFPAVVVMPQCRKKLWWNQPPMDEVAIKALEAATKEFHGDADRTYLTGLSMGGYGTWFLAGKYPGRFAALIVICGGAVRPEQARLQTTATDAAPYKQIAEKVGKTPVWMFHGADDDRVPVTESRRMYAAMKALGGEVHYTEFPGVKHPSWDKAYDDPKLFPWLFSKSLTENSSAGKLTTAKSNK